MEPDLSQKGVDIGRTIGYLDLPALVNFCSATVPAGGPGAVADPNQVGAGEKDKKIIGRRWRER